jgi:CubicO group peptidase (beta-lactamase class C family)
MTNHNPNSWKRMAGAALVMLPAAGMMAGPVDDSSPLWGAMEKFVESGEIAGSVTLVANAEGVIYEGVNGQADREAGIPMSHDALFWIASMTKPITGTAVMMMLEEGKLTMDDPVSKHLPEFADLKNRQGEPVAVTIRQLLTHSAGLSELSTAQASQVKSLAELTPLVAAKPVQFPPGSKWQYCQTGINTAARIVEVVSGQSFPDFLAQRLFVPLGMKDTTFYPTGAQAKRLATSYHRSAAGTLEKASISLLGGKPVTNRDRCPLANGGLFSTAEDYATFCRMILRGGELDGRRYLKPESVAMMTSVQSGALVTGFTPGNGWGLGWCVVCEPQGVSAALSAGSFGHGGAFGTQAWVDPVRQRIYILMVQRANFPNSDASEVRRVFQQLAAERK